jgi:hypothetical protein
MRRTDQIQKIRQHALIYLQRLAVPPEVLEHGGAGVPGDQRVGMARADNFGLDRGESVNLCQ